MQFCEVGLLFLFVFVCLLAGLGVLHFVSARLDATSQFVTVAVKSWVATENSSSKNGFVHSRGGTYYPSNNL